MRITSISPPNKSIRTRLFTESVFCKEQGRRGTVLPRALAGEANHAQRAK